MRFKLLFILIGFSGIISLFLVFLNLRTEETLATTKSAVDLENTKELDSKVKNNFESVDIDTDLQKLVQNIYSKDKKVREINRKKVVNLAKDSGSNRKKIIDLILLSLDIPNIKNGLVSPQLNYEGWTFALNILGEIKASEALPALIKCLSCNNGLGGLSINRYPVTYAVSMIGDESIPFLKNVLQESNKDNTTRMCAILALGSIKNENSKKALEESLLTEKNESFRKIIKNLLSDK